MARAKPKASLASRAELRPQLKLVERSGHVPPQRDDGPAQAPTGGRPDEAQTPDAKAVARSRADTVLFERIVSQVRPDLYRYAFWLSRNASLADDLVQEALIRGWRFLPSLRDGSAAKQWLITIVRREYARTFEKRRLRAVDIEEIDSAEEGLATDPPDPDIETLRRAIAELDADYREPLLLQTLFGYSTEDIGRMMGITQGATLTRLYRARKKLAAALNAPEEATHPAVEQ